MYKSILSICVTALWLCASLTPSALAQEKPAGRDAATQLSQPAKASSIIGMPVRNPEGDHIGNIKDMVLDLPSSRIVYAVLSAGGFLGVDDKYFAIPPTAFTQSGEADHLILNTDQDALRRAPGFDKENWPDVAGQGRVEEVYRHRPFWTPHPPPDESAVAGSRPGALPEPDAAEPADAPEPEGQARIEAETQIDEPAGAQRGGGQPIRASELIGKRVRNSQGEELGEIKDLAVDLPSGRVVYAVLSAGGFLGIGKKLLALPPGALSSGKDERTFLFKAGREQIKAAPGFTGDDWPDRADPQWSAELYRFHGQQPDDATADKPRGAAPETRLADRELTQLIRRALMEDDTLSFLAKNVHIGIGPGQVTLRGEVKTQAEKESILAAANRIIRLQNLSDNIIDEIKVQTQ